MYDGKVNNQHTLFKNMRMSASRRDILRELELLVIDEVSMVRADLLDAMDAVLRHFRRQPLFPFGGVQVIYIGDLFQLPPVVKNDEWNLLKEFYQSPFFFDAQVMQQAPPVNIELKKIYRQSDDAFIRILNNIRNNQCTPQDLEHLHQFYKPQFEAPEGEQFITLTTHNEKADAINRAELKRLPGKLHQFDADVSGEFSDRSFPADAVLQLKVGAQVMFLKNDVGENRKFYNGKIGTIQSIKGDEILVGFPGESEAMELKKETWQNIRYHYHTEKDKIEEEELGTFTQYPIRLAWAITIHKSQGLTFEKAIVDAGASFAAGQVYVALSRLTGLEGLVLQSKISLNGIQTDPRVVQFVKQELSEEALRQTLLQEQQLFIRHSLVRSFDWARIWELAHQHLEGYEHRQIPHREASISWAGKILSKTQELQEIALKFQKQLEWLYDSGASDQYRQLHQRTDAACTYFIKQIDEELLPSIHNHIEVSKQQTRVKKYLKELNVLMQVFERKKYELQNALQVSAALIQSEKGSNVLQAVEALHQPIVVPVQEAKEVPVRKKAKGESHRMSLQMFKEGKSIEDIAQERNLAYTTIEGHLISFIPAGEIDVLDLMNAEKLEIILTLLEKNPEVPSTELKQQLPDDYSFGDIRAAQKFREKQNESSETDSIKNPL